MISSLNRYIFGFLYGLNFLAGRGDSVAHKTDKTKLMGHMPHMSRPASNSTLECEVTIFHTSLNYLVPHLRHWRCLKFVLKIN